MTIVALEINSREFVASRVAEGIGDEDIRRIPIPADDPWRACAALLTEVAAGADVQALGIAATGPIDMAAGVLAPLDIPSWRAGFEIVEAARRVFPGAEVRLGLDGVCLALAERNFGSTGTVMDALSISVAQHVAGGVLAGGFVVVGRTGNAGNVGHVLVPGFDEPCVCGGRGCLEAVAGAAGLLAWAQANGWSGASVEDLAVAAESGDEIAVAAVARAGTALGRAIASVAALLDVDLVVLGGSLAQSGAALWKPLGAAVAEHARVSYLPGLRVVPSELGDVGVLAGAGVLAVTAVQ